MVFARIGELLWSKTPWSRSLWSVGTSFMIAELLDACSPPQAQTLSDASLRNVLDTCKRDVFCNPVVSKDEKAEFARLLSTVPDPRASSFSGLRQLCERLDVDYMVRWARLFHDGVSHVGTERIARSIATHLLDLQFSDTFLSQWLRTTGRRAFDDSGLASLCEHAHRELVLVGELPFTLAFLFRTPMPSGFQPPPNWLGSAAAVSDWLKSNGFSTTGIRAPSGICMTVSARDKFAALEKGWAAIDNYVARASMATGKLLDPLAEAWIQGDGASPFKASRRSRGVQVGMLHLQSRIFTEFNDSNLDAALALLSHLEHGSPTAAVAGGWAAIESLLGEPQDRSAAADNLACLVACSFPRAELTALSYSAARHDALLESRMTGLAKRERAVEMGRMIRANSLSPMIAPSDQAAVCRLQMYFSQPSAYLADLRRSIGQAFLRLYRQRNHILHGGITSSIALPPTLRTTAKLAGAGMDRIAHGHYGYNVKPIELAARAKLAIAFAAPTDSTERLISLLGA
jgi:hypothetical protein